MTAHDRLLMDACKTANDDAEVRDIEKEFDAITDEPGEPRDMSRGSESGD